MELNKKDKKRMYSLRGELKANDILLGKSDWVISKRKKKKIKEKNAKIEEELIEFRNKYNDPEIDIRAYNESVESNVFYKMGDNLEKTGDKMKSTGKGMMSAGLHTTAAVWAPPVYIAYRGVKAARKKPKIESVEQDLIELIKEVEQAHKDGKITEELKREYIIDFVDNYYKK